MGKCKKNNVLKDRSFGRYYRKMATENSLSAPSIQVLDSMMEDIFSKIVTEASKLCKRSGRKTLTSRDMEFASKLVIPGNLGKHAVSQADRVMKRWKKPNINSNGEYTSSFDSDYDLFRSNVRFHSSPQEADEISNSITSSGSSVSSLMSLNSSPTSSSFLSSEGKAD